MGWVVHDASNTMKPMKKESLKILCYIASTLSSVLLKLGKLHHFAFHLMAKSLIVVA